MDDLKDFYRSHADKILDKRVRTPYALRRYVHDRQYRSVLDQVAPGMHVLDAGCGEGYLSVLMARKGARVTGCDLSVPNIAASQAYAKEEGVEIAFAVADLERLPYEDNSFDLVVSSHVLEHLPDFDAGLAELLRVTDGRAIVAIPTVMNLCSFVQVGHGWFYLKGVRSFLALPYGFLRMLWGLVCGREGVDERYEGEDVPHVFRFPWILPAKARRLGARVIYREASSLALPYFETFLPLSRFIDRFRSAPLLRLCGYGTTYVLEKGSVGRAG